jgi:uncharacterized membrane protein YphA (DoxX/SURF4 family)
MYQKWICYVVGYVFVTSGILKLVDNDFQAVFASLGLPFPRTTLFLVAITELACGMLIIARMHIKHATIPLIIVMIGALCLTKWPIFVEQGLLTFAFEARLDMVMLVLLLLLGQPWKGVYRRNG